MEHLGMEALGVALVALGIVVYANRAGYLCFLARRRSILLLTTVTTIAFWLSHADADPLDTKRSLDAACRAGHVDETKTEHDCQLRDEYVKKLPSLGYCYYTAQLGDTYWLQGAASDKGECIALITIHMSAQGLPDCPDDGRLKGVPMTSEIFKATIFKLPQHACVIANPNGTFIATIYGVHRVETQER